MNRDTKPFIVTAPHISGLETKPPVSVNGHAVHYELDTPIQLTEAAASAISDCAALTITPHTPEPIDDDFEHAPAQDEPDADTDLVEQVMTAQTQESPASSGEDDAAASPSGGSDDGGGDTAAEATE